MPCDSISAQCAFNHRGFPNGQPNIHLDNQIYGFSWQVFETETTLNTVAFHESPSLGRISDISLHSQISVESKFIISGKKLSRFLFRKCDQAQLIKGCLSIQQALLADIFFLPLHPFPHPSSQSSTGCVLSKWRPITLI